MSSNCFSEWAEILQGFMKSKIKQLLKISAFYLDQGLWTLNEGINQRYLKNWADVEDKICFGRT
jgi:hypothetical protein